MLVTGGAGYIGSHVVFALLEAGYEVVVLDNLSNGSREALSRVKYLTNCEIEFFEGDVRDPMILKRIFSSLEISSVIHLAGLKAVGDSTKQPFVYFDNNFVGTLRLCQEMKLAGVFKLVFSSSATVYGDPERVPISEIHPVGATTSPYGRSKYFSERLLQDLAATDANWCFATLRYFNPAGAHESGFIGEDPIGVPTNLIPYLCQVCVGRYEYLPIFGNDYQTFDRTGVRDYVHVMDVAEGHVAALRALDTIGPDSERIRTWNLGMGRGHSVLEIVRALELVTGRTIPIKFEPRRPGDVAESYADVSKAKYDLNWNAKRDLSTIVQHAWRWQSNNPAGYKARGE